MTREEMAAQILELVEKWQPTTFHELVKKLGKEAKGEQMATMPNRPNLVLWDGVSDLFIDALNILHDKLFIVSTSELIYMMDGGVLNLPIWSKLNHKKPHWVPTAISIRTEENQAEIDAIKAKKKRAA